MWKPSPLSEGRVSAGTMFLWVLLVALLGMVLAPQAFWVRVSIALEGLLG